MRNKTLFSLVLILSFTIIVLRYTYIIAETKSEITTIFHDVVDIDLYKRVKSPEVNLRKIENTGIQSDTTGVHFRSETEDRIIPYTEKVTREKVYLDDRQIHHSASRMLKPISTSTLDSLFYSYVINAGFKAETAVIYKDQKDGVNHHSNTDMTIYNVSLHSDLLVFGLEQEVAVQAFVRPTTPLILQRPDALFYLSLFVAICSLGGYIFTFYAKRKRVSINGKKIELLEDGLFQLGDYLVDTTSGLLIYNEVAVDISKRQEYTVLLALLNAPNHHLSKEDVLDLLDKKEMIGNQTNTCFSRLRSLLKNDPDLLISYRGGHYYLELSNQRS
jgi:Response regulators consisting of a CheY-like receiver domain and a winged-helix DNA-binding domain